MEFAPGAVRGTAATTFCLMRNWANLLPRTLADATPGPPALALPPPAPPPELPAPELPAP
ncbi:hypothetical protein AB4Y45_17560 [Paraburkholderia sp. EG287A]|uniref:hypothetical protein n=1 Tax=unclassified Paraburkholderia TaxID=2615204 RepID=UPI0034D1E55B